MKTILVAALAALALTACGGEMDPSDELAAALNLAPADTARVLDFVNYPGTDKALLDGAVGLDERAAQNIILKRNGADKAAPSADDQPFTTLIALDAVSYVTDTALQKLAAYSSLHPAPASQTVETVSFAGWEAEAVVYGVNHGAQAELAPMLDARSVTAILAQRPFAALSAIAAVPWVGPSALGKLKAHAPFFWAQLRGTAGLAGTFDGVTFDEASAKTALAIANQATLAQMSSNGVPAAPAAGIVGNRPYTSLAQVAAVGGVATATMKGLLAYAQSGRWAAPPSACVVSFENTVGPLLPDLLFMSESDRPFDLMTWQGQGTSTLTAAAFFALLHKPANWTFESRDPANYYEVFEPANANANPNAGAQVQAAFGALTDVIYVAVHQPAGSLYQAEVDVYLVGRTSCGDIVGIHAIAIET